MAGNETLYRSPRAYLPVSWLDSNLPPSTTRKMGIAGAPPGMDAIPVPKRCSVTAISVLISEAVTAGTLSVTLQRNGVVTGIQTVVDAASGVARVADIPPNAARYDLGDTVGVILSSSAGFAPAAQIDTLVFLEVQND